MQIAIWPVSQQVVFSFGLTPGVVTGSNPGGSNVDKVSALE